MLHHFQRNADTRSTHQWRDDKRRIELSSGRQREGSHSSMHFQQLSVCTCCNEISSNLNERSLKPNGINLYTTLHTNTLTLQLQ